MTKRKEDQHDIRLAFFVLERVKDVNDDVEDVQRSPGHKEDDGDSDEHPVCLLAPFHLPSSSVGRETFCLTAQSEANPVEKNRNGSGIYC